MKDEIKKILNDIENIECYYIGINGCLYQDLEKEELLCIKDYITNLEQERNMFEGSFETMSENYFKEKSKNEKAIEYIKKSMNNPQPFYEYLFGDENGKVENLDKLLNILNGENNG